VFLQDQAEELAEKVALIERNLASYAEENAIVSLNENENIVVTRMAELSALLTESTARRIISQTRHEEALKAAKATKASFADEAVSTTRIKLKEAEAEYALLSEKFTPNYPRMQQLQARIDTLKENLEAAKREAIQILEATYKADRETEAALKEQLEMQKSRAFELSRREVQYNVMKREYESLRDLHQAVLRQLKEAQLSSQSSGTNISMAEYAAVPSSPSSPRTQRNLAFAFLIGPLIGGVLALVIESLDNTIKTPDEAQKLLRLPALGVVPMFSLDYFEGTLQALPEVDEDDTAGDPTNGELPSDPSNVTKDLVVREKNRDLITISAPRSMASEAFRTIRTSILLSSADDHPRVILTTSGQKAEGKTTFLTNLSVTVAQSSNKTLLIDADLRRPAIHRHFGFRRNEVGLVEYLTGLEKLSTVIHETPVSNLSIIPAGVLPPNPSELLGSKKMKELLERLSQEYEYVFVDAPPILPVADAVILSRFVDGVVLVVRGQSTTQQVARNAANKLRQIGARVLGVVLNDVDFRSADYYYYRKSYYSYYFEDEEDHRRKKSKIAAG